MYEAEERQWWYAGQRAIVLALLGARSPLGRAATAARRGLRHGLQPGGARRTWRARSASTSRPKRSRFCRERGVCAVRGSVLALPFRDGGFDAVTSFDVIYHDWVSDERAAVAGDGARAAPGRVVLVRVPALRGAAGARTTSRCSPAIVTPGGELLGVARRVRARARAGDLLQLASLSAAARPPQPRPPARPRGLRRGLPAGSARVGLPPSACSPKRRWCGRGLSLPDRCQRGGAGAQGLRLPV